MSPVHITEDNFLRSAIVFFNKANKFGLNDAAILSLTTVAGLEAALDALQPDISELNYIRQLKELIDSVLKYLTVPFGIPAKPVGTKSGAGSGFGAGTYYYKVVGVDEQGRLTVPSEESTGVVITIEDQISVAYTNITYAFKHRIYRRISTGVYDHYFEDALTPFVDTGTAGTAGVIQTGDSLAGAAILTDAKVAAADTFAGLLTFITEASNTTLDSTNTSGEEPV